MREAETVPTLLEAYQAERIVALTKRTQELDALQNGTTRVFHATLNDGRYVQFFANVETGLLVVDVVDADEEGGVEVFRRVV